MRLFEKKIIMGCDMKTPLLERVNLLSTPFGSLRLHHFLRSDEDREVHDHPWAYVTLILRGGYLEQVPERRYDEACSCSFLHLRFWGTGVVQSKLVRRAPGQILFRPAKWAHRVVLEHGKDAWTLIFMFPKTREWGFHTYRGWLPWYKYNSVAACAEDAK